MVVTFMHRYLAHSSWIKIIDRNRKSRRDEMVLSLAPRALVL
jgi:hypothetical protein